MHIGVFAIIVLEAITCGDQIIIEIGKYMMINKQIKLTYLMFCFYFAKSSDNCGVSNVSIV